MIDKRELLEKARQKKLSLAVMEKDYVLGWLLFAASKVTGLMFKGGTALAKIYFPQIWRLSEDADFLEKSGEFDAVSRAIQQALSEASEMSGITFQVKSIYSNPDYLQMKVQYCAILIPNWVKLDVVKDSSCEPAKLVNIHQSYSDYPKFRLRTLSVEEIMAEKIRALIERKKCRDYYDVWMLTKRRINHANLRKLFLKKCAAKGITFKGINDFFPDGLPQTLTPYWERELGRLVSPLPSLDAVLATLREQLRLLE